MPNEFNFENKTNKEWLLPFLKDFKKQSISRDNEQLKTDAINFAIANINKLFKKTVFKGMRE